MHLRSLVRSSSLTHSQGRLLLSFSFFIIKKHAVLRPHEESPRTFWYGMSFHLNILLVIGPFKIAYSVNNSPHTIAPQMLFIKSKEMATMNKSIISQATVSINTFSCRLLNFISWSRTPSLPRCTPHPLMVVWVAAGFLEAVLVGLVLLSFS